MTTPTNPDADLVERTEAALRAYNDAWSVDDVATSVTDLGEALGMLRRALSGIPGDHPTVRAVAGVLLGGGAEPDTAVDNSRPDIVEASLVLALADAMQHARVEMDATSLRPTSLTVALMAEHMIQHGWPATRPPWRVVTPEDGQS